MFIAFLYFSGISIFFNIFSFPGICFILGLTNHFPPGVELSRLRSVPHPHTFGEDDDHDDDDDDDDDGHDDGNDVENDGDDDETTTMMMTTPTTTRGRVVRELSTEQLGCRPRLQTEVLQHKHHHHHHHHQQTEVLQIKHYHHTDHRAASKVGKVGKVFIFL